MHTTVGSIKGTLCVCLDKNDIIYKLSFYSQKISKSVCLDFISAANLNYGIKLHYEKVSEKHGRKVMLCSYEKNGNIFYIQHCEQSDKSKALAFEIVNTKLYNIFKKEKTLNISKDF